MHYSTRPVDPLDHLSGLGWWQTAAAVAADYMTKRSGGTSTAPQGANTPGSEPSVPRQPSSLSTVSTAVVTQVSPQISPTMSQQQSSPGATVGANPVQYMPGGLSAEQSVTPFGNYGMPGFPTNQAGISPLQPYGMDPMTGQYYPLSSEQMMRGGGAYSPVSVGGSRMTDIPWLPIALIAGGAGLIWVATRRRKKRA